MIGLSVFLSFCLSVVLSICLSVLFVVPFMSLFICLPAWLSVYLSVHFSTCLSVCLSDCLSVCLSDCLSVFLCFCLRLTYFFISSVWVTGCDDSKSILSCFFFQIFDKKLPIFSSLPFLCTLTSECARKLHPQYHSIKWTTCKLSILITNSPWKFHFFNIHFKLFYL